MKKEKLTGLEKEQIIVKQVRDELHRLTKAELIEIAKEFDEKFPKNSTKYDTLKFILKNIENDKIALEVYYKYKHKGFGCMQKFICETLNITPYRARQLYKYGFIKRDYIIISRLYRDTFFNLYNLEDVLNLVGEDIDNLLQEKKKEAKRYGGN